MVCFEGVELITLPAKGTVTFLFTCHPNVGLSCKVVQDTSGASDVLSEEQVRQFLDAFSQRISFVYGFTSSLNYPLDKVQVESDHQLKLLRIFSTSQQDMSDSVSETAKKMIKRAWGHDPQASEGEVFDDLITAHIEDNLISNYKKTSLASALFKLVGRLHEALDKTGGRESYEATKNMLWARVKALPNIPYLCDNDTEASDVYRNLMSERGWPDTVIRVLGVTASRILIDQGITHRGAFDFTLPDSQNSKHEQAVHQFEFLMVTMAMLQTAPDIWGEVCTEALLDKTRCEKLDALYDFVSGLCALAPHMSIHHVNSLGQALFNTHPQHLSLRCKEYPLLGIEPPQVPH
jgi:hypothetical protein